MARMPDRVSRYHWTLVLLHWSIAFLVVAALALGALVMARIPSSDPMKVEALRTHMTGGLAILGLMLVRLVVRARWARPAAAATGHRWFDRLAWVSHSALYVAVIGMAVAGLTMGIETGVVALVFGGHPPVPDDFWVYPIRAVHYAISRVLMVLIALHVSGAAYHTFVRRDGLLRRMWFGRRAVLAGPPAGAARAARSETRALREAHTGDHPLFSTTERQPMTKLAQVRIVTDDVPALTRFYQGVTGMTPNGDARYVEFRTPALALAISSVPMINQHSGAAAVPAANRTVILDFEVEDVDAERARLASLVREFVLEPADRPWGNRSLMFRDPDGNLINFYSPIRAAATRNNAAAEA